ncbi:phytoene desaturase family protein [Paenibacillus sp. PL2-23]|uniref:phytoene desaturase family protein n=1 Tax=Paenibacillus sp. PL2-23 TaxID=2100729 RepID=UPI0030F75A24
MSKRAAFVGGGVGAMTTALLLTRQGYQVTIYEKSARLGGRLAFQEGQGYKIDQGPTIVLLPDMLLDILEEAGIERSRLPLLACDPMYNIHYSEGTVLRKHRSVERMAEELERVFPGEAAGFRRYMEETRELFLQGKRSFLDQAFTRKKDFYTWRNLSLLMKFKAYKSARYYASRYFKDERLLDAYSLQTLYIGGVPERSPALYTLLPYAEHEYGVWYLKGGYASLVDLLREELERRGVEIRTNTAVERLQVKDGRCKGVRVMGCEEAFDTVIYNGDFPHLHSLLPGESKPPARRYEPSTGCTLLYLGLGRRYEHAAAHQFFLPPSLSDSLREMSESGMPPEKPSYYIFYPTAIDPEAAPEGGSVMYVLIPSPPQGSFNWKEGAAALAERVLADAERRAFPGLREAVQWQDIRTPEDAAADGLYRGGSFGIAPTLKQSAVFRPQIVPYEEIKGLYAVGASIHPGGGIPIVMQGARLLANQLAKESCSHVDRRISRELREDDSPRILHIP